MRHPLRLLLPLLLLIVCTTAGAQTLYELTYHFDKKSGRENYKAFIYRNDDGTGFIRVEYFDVKTNARNLIEMDMQESYGQDDDGKEDSTMLIFVGLEPKQLVGDDKYEPDNYVFELNPEDGFYEPSFVLSMHESGKNKVGTLDNIRLLQQEDLTEDFVLQYFSPEDDFYVSLFKTTVRGLTNDEKQTRLHLVLVANTLDETIGKSSVTDRDGVLKMFSEIAEFLGIQFSPTVIAGTDFNKTNVEKAVNNLHPGRQDIVVFYYTGHGFNQNKESYQFPYLDLRDKGYQMWGGQYTMNIEAVYQKIRSKGARFNLIISDCCNADPDKTNNLSSEGATTRGSSIGWNMDNCRALFMDPKPMSMLLTAATKGELSAGNPIDGGFFTNNLRASLDKFFGPMFKEVTWAQVLDNAKKQTIYKAQHTWCFDPDNTKHVCAQTPVFKVE